jgi:hypothetical protein
MDEVEGTTSPVPGAVTQLVARFGSAVAGDPRRMRAGLNDVLGSEARRYRAEIDAVVLAAEELGPEQLADPRLVRADALARLGERGLAGSTAQFALGAWRVALGASGPEDQVIPASGLPVGGSLPDPITDPAIQSEPETDPVMDFGPPTNPMSAPTPPPAPAPPPVMVPGGFGPPPSAPPPPPPSPAPATRPPGKRRHRLVLGVCGVVAFLLIAGAAVAVPRLGDDGDGPTVVKSGSSTTTTTEAGKKPTETAAVEKFATRTLPWGAHVARTWTVDHGTFTGKLVFTNPGKKSITGGYREILPTSLASTGSKVSTEPKAQVAGKAPVLVWLVKLQPGKPNTYTYTVKVKSSAGAKELKQWREDMVTAVEKQREKDKHKAGIQVLTPGNGQLVDQATIPVKGVTDDPKAKISVNGKSVKLDGKTFTTVVTLAPGQNIITISSLTEAGVSHSVQVAVTYQQKTTGGGGTNPGGGATNPGGGSGTNPGGGGGTNPGGGGGTTTTTTTKSTTPTVGTIEGNAYVAVSTGGCTYPYTLQTSEAPDYVNWATYDPNGQWHYFNNKGKTFSFWFEGSGTFYIYATAYFNGVAAKQVSVYVIADYYSSC